MGSDYSTTMLVTVTVTAPLPVAVKFGTSADLPLTSAAELSTLLISTTCVVAASSVWPSKVAFVKVIVTLIVLPLTSTTLSASAAGIVSANVLPELAVVVVALVKDLLIKVK